MAARPRRAVPPPSPHQPVFLRTVARRLTDPTRPSDPVPDPKPDPAPDPAPGTPAPGQPGPGKPGPIAPPDLPDTRPDPIPTPETDPQPIPAHDPPGTVPPVWSQGLMLEILLGEISGDQMEVRA